MVMIKLSDEKSYFAIRSGVLVMGKNWKYNAVSTNIISPYPGGLQVDWEIFKPNAVNNTIILKYSCLDAMIDF